MTAVRKMRSPSAVRVTRSPGPLPHWMIDWPTEAAEEFHERAALVADGCKLPQRSEQAERLAEAIVRDEWAKWPKEIEQ